MAYPEHLITLGGHIRNRRLDLGLHLKDVTLKVNATTSSVANWEKGRSNPRLYLFQKVIEFLGYDSFPAPTLIVGEKIRAYRRTKALSSKKLAQILSIDPTTLARWEHCVRRPRGNSSAGLESSWDFHAGQTKFRV